MEFADALLASNKPGSVYRLLEVINMFSSGQWTGSFLLAWITVEEAIDAELIIHFLKGGMQPAQAEAKVRAMSAKKVISKLKARTPIPLNPPDPTPFDSVLLTEFDDLRDLRNNVVHEGVQATEADAKRMKDASSRAMWRLIRHRRLNYDSYLKRIAPLQAATRLRLDPPSVNL
jgi:hypothetical protein